ncbi:MAG: hypothetical protein IIC67_05765 [Thaumarchaeota archaeon]|nr:hypothetical protein [Nitrososphaerota archaeon]
MEYLKKDDIFFERSEEGKLLPIEVVLETLPSKPTVRVTPMSKGELAEIVSKTKGSETDVDTDIDMVISHCKDPLFVEEDRDSLKLAGKTVFINAIALAILSISTATEQKDLVEQGKAAFIEKELANFREQ